LVVAANVRLGVNSLQDLITKAKRQPGVLNYATAGNGSAPHLCTALFSQTEGADTQVTFGIPPLVLPMIQASRLRALAVAQR
jgi:tripartite-type tricarboxylate transporter receptor subunit TctC